MAVQYRDRRFQVWEYRVGHGSLLLRSPKGQQHDRNVDVVLVGVEYLALPHVLDGLSIVPASDDDLRRVAVDFALADRDSVFVLVSGGKRHLVVASSCEVNENDGDIFDSPF